MTTANDIKICGRNRTVLFTLPDSYVLRGIAVILITLCHYCYWDSMWQKHYIVFDILTRVGTYGVSIFFLLSGYALYKTTANKPVTPLFLWKRLKNSYIPYLLIAGAIEILQDEFLEKNSLINLLSGTGHWYIYNIIRFYIAFFVIWRFFRQEKLRVSLILLFTVAFSVYLHRSGHNDFWIVSNAAFPFGILLAYQEKKVLKWLSNGFLPVFGILLAGMVFFCWLGMWGYEDIDMHETGMYWLIGANMWFCLFIVYLGQVLFYHSRLFIYMGKHSLYLYLLHTPVYFQVMAHLTDKWPKTLIIAILITLLTAGLIHILCNRLLKLLERSAKKATKS